MGQGWDPINCIEIMYLIDGVWGQPEPVNLDCSKYACQRPLGNVRSPCTLCHAWFAALARADPPPPPPLPAPPTQPQVGDRGGPGVGAQQDGAVRRAVGEPVCDRWELQHKCCRPPGGSRGRLTMTPRPASRASSPVLVLPLSCRKACVQTHGQHACLPPSSPCRCCAELGRVASHYYIRHSSIVVFNEHLRPHMGEADVLAMISQSSGVIAAGGVLCWVARCACTQRARQIRPADTSLCTSARGLGAWTRNERRQR